MKSDRHHQPLVPAAGSVLNASFQCKPEEDAAAGQTGSLESERAVLLPLSAVTELQIGPVSLLQTAHQPGPAILHLKHSKNNTKCLQIQLVNLNSCLVKLHSPVKPYITLEMCRSDASHYGNKSISHTGGEYLLQVKNIMNERVCVVAPSCTSVHCCKSCTCQDTAGALKHTHNLIMIYFILY